MSKHEYVYVHMDEHMGRNQHKNWDRNKFEEEYGLWPTIVPNLMVRHLDRKAEVILWHGIRKAELRVFFL